MLSEKVVMIKKGAVSAEKNVKDFLEVIAKKNKDINALLQVNPQAVEQARAVDVRVKKGTAGKLAGLGFVVKANMCVEGLIASCASRTLEGFVAPYSATVIERLFAEDAIVLGVTNMDEFACGSSGETSAFGPVKNPCVLDRIPGGSSSGSAAAVAAGFCDFALGSDTGGSIRNPASHCGIVGFKPSYGAVSRYGLIDLAMSLDQIGPLASSADDCAFVFEVMKGYDPRDATSQDFVSKRFSKTLRVAVLQLTARDDIWNLVHTRLHMISEQNGWTVEPLSVPHVDLGIQTYYPLNYVEFFSGTRKFDGRKYGRQIETSCGEEVLRRILGGKSISKAEFEGKYYRKALAVRQVIKNAFATLFSTYDLVVLPTVPRLPHRLGEKMSVEDMYEYDALTVLANLAELPAISVPAGDLEGIPVGLQIMGARGDDEKVLNAARCFDRS